jgi:4-amino-4-deoxy-L-arabinose transferase-like glycosyltransferase
MLLLAAFSWLACTAWLRPLALPDEGRYVGVAWEMVRSGDWITPTLNGLPYFHKPPLFYWLTAPRCRCSATSNGPAASRPGPAPACWPARPTCSGAAGSGNAAASTGCWCC